MKILLLSLSEFLLIRDLCLKEKEMFSYEMIDTRQFKIVLSEEFALKYGY